MYSTFDDLARAIRARNAILFAGAGVSMSVGLPNWSMLIGHLRRELGLPEAVDDRTAYQVLAEYYRIQKGSIGPLRSWMDRAWNVPVATVERSEIHRLLVDLDFPIIYTTNYDNNLEIAHAAHGRQFTKISNVRDLTKLREGDRQIVKFHGDFDDDESLVITETDYFDRLAFDSPLDLKFRSDSLGRTLLFVGYSLSDLNIRLLLHRLWRTWRNSGRERDRPSLFLFAPQVDVVRDAVLGQWGITTLSGEVDDPAESLRLFLARLKDGVENG